MAKYIGYATNTLVWVFFAQMYVSAIFSWPGFDITMLEIDWMHTADLGVLVTVLGNCLLEMFFVLGGTFSNPGQALAKLLTMLTACSRGKPPINDLTMGMVCAGPSHPPILKVKAGEARYLLPIVRRMMLDFFEGQSPHARLRAHMINALQKCYDLLDDYCAESMAVHGRKFHMFYNQLNLEAVSENKFSQRWRIYPKFHLFIHLCEQGYNPKDTWNYSDESAIGDCARTTQLCHSRFSSTTIIQKHRVFKYGC